MFFRPSSIAIEHAETHPHNAGFKYPPYKLVVRPVGKFMSNGYRKINYRFGMIILHTTPQDPVTEMNNLAREAKKFMSDKGLAGEYARGKHKMSLGGL